jgi:hypothetical protein
LKKKVFKMATNTLTGIVVKPAETLTLPAESSKQVPGGFEVEYAGSKWFTGTASNPNYVPPKDFTFPGNTEAVSLNPQGPTEMPQKLTADYTDVSLHAYLNCTTVLIETGSTNSNTFCHAPLSLKSRLWNPMIMSIVPSERIPRRTLCLLR